MSDMHTPPKKTPTTNGTQPPASSAPPPLSKKAVGEIFDNAMSMLKRDIFAQILDPRRDYNDECGFPTEVTIDLMKDMYERSPIAARVVELLPRESWQVTPSVYEEEESEEPTEFEKAWDELGRTLSPTKSWYKSEESSRVWEYLKRVDELSGIGTFGILLIGIDDGKPMDSPADGVDLFPNAAGDWKPSKDADKQQPYGSGGTDDQYWDIFFSYDAVPKTPKAKDDREVKTKHKVVYLRPFDESQVTISRFENRKSNPRYGQPTLYQITLNDPNERQSGIGSPMGTINVHWTRVLHIADNLKSSEVFGTPRQKAVFNNLIGLVKLYGSSPEMFWRGAFMGISLETHPQLGGDVNVNETEIRDMMERYGEGLQRFIVGKGLSAKPLAPQVSDPTAQIAVQLQAICILIGCPLRIFMGSERGELASSQDDSAWNDRLRSREKDYITPRIICPFIDRLIAMGCLPEPGEAGYSVEWPDIESLSDLDRANIFNLLVTGLGAYIQGGVEAIVPPLELLTKLLEMDEEEAQAIMDAAKKHLEETNPETPDENIVPGHLPSPPVPELPPDAPIKMKGGEALVDPKDGAKIAAIPAPPPKPVAKK